MSDSVVDVRSTRALLRRRSRLLAAGAVLGLALGVTYVLVVPPRLTSTALVLLPTPTNDPASTKDVPTQVRIATSTSVLSAAGRRVRPPLPAREVDKQVQVSAPTEQLLEVDASSPSAEQARELAQALAEQYVAFSKESEQRVATVALADLRTREGELQQQLEDLQQEIKATQQRQSAVPPTSADGRKEAQLLAGLRTEQAVVSLRLDTVKGQIATSAPVGGSGGTTIVQDATEATGASLVRRLLTWVPVGAVLGLGLTVLLLVATTRRDPRMGLRDEIADSVGSPVLAAVRSRPQRSVAGWKALLTTYEATAVESWAFRQVLRTLGAVEGRDQGHHGDGRQGVDHPASVLVVSLAGDARGLAIGPQLAGFASSLGIRTRLVTATGHDRAAALWAAARAEQLVQLRPSLVIGPDDTVADQDIELTICLAVADRRAPSLTDVPRTSTTLLAVAAASATEQELARVAVAVDDAARRIDGVVVADPDRADRTSGRHTMDERAGRIALPIRLTGSSGLGGQRQRGGL